MSNSNNNHNHPHGHLSQPAQNPNPSWNPLQIPSYIPRQPQLAHMSNERNMVRSPLTWHTTAQPPDAIYNFMSAANHKNLEHHQMNPLLAPPYVTGTLPFDSMDLSLQSSRSATSPLNKSGLPPQASQQAHGPPTQQQHQQQQHQQQQHQHLHSPSNYSTIHNLSANAPSSAHSQVQHVTQQHTHNVHQSPAHAPPPPMSPAAAAASAKYLNTNGTDCESLLPPSSAASTAAASSSNNTGATNYIPTSCEESYGKMTQIKRNYDNESKSTQKPIELVSKDCSYPTAGGLSNKLGPHTLHGSGGGHVSGKKNSPLRNYPQQQQQHHHPHHHHQQQQQQQQQQLQSYNMPPMPTTNMKYNSPQTPPTPHSLIMQQNALSSSMPSAHHHQIHSPSGAGTQGQGPPPIDSNQLHLQHHMHTLNYGLPHHQAQQQQQEQQHHHYGPPLPQHHSQQMNQQQQQQQQQSHQQQLQTHLSQQHSQQQQLHSRNSSSSNAMPMNSPHLTNLDTLPKHATSTSNREESKSIEEQQPQPLPPVIADLSTTSYKSTLQQPPPPPPTIPADLERTTSMPDAAPESPFTGTSNEESLESNSNSSSSRMRRKRKPSHVMRVTPNEKVVVVPPEHNEQQIQFTQQHQQQQHEQQNERTPNRCSNSRSPKQSPAPEHKSPRSNFSLNLTTPPSNHDKETSSETTAQFSPENGRPIISPKRREECIANKASEVIPRVVSSNNESNNFNNSNVFHEGCEDSPRTKKQRQALIQRNITEMQPLVICDASSSPKANEEKDEAAVITSEPSSSDIKTMMPAPPSPHSISSSSSSSNSSGGSHSSHSSSHSNDNQVVDEQRREESIVPQAMIRPASPPALQETDTKHSTHSASEEIKQFQSSPKDDMEMENKSEEDRHLSPIKMQKFEEVENKLEEMFAGIEDEPPAHENESQTPNARRPSTRSATEDDLSLALELDTISCPKEIAAPQQPEQQKPRQSSPLPQQVQVAPKKPRMDSRPIATKAAMKSTVPSPPRRETPEIESPEEEKIKTHTPQTPPTPSTPQPIESSPVPQSPADVTDSPVTSRRQIPRRRNSLGMDPAQLRISMEIESKAKKPPTPRKNTQKKCTPPTPTPALISFDDDQPSTSAAAIAALAARAREEREAAEAMEKMRAAVEKSSSTPTKSIKKKKSPKGKASKAAAAASGGGGSPTKGAGNKKGSKNQTKQQKQNRNKALSSDEGIIPAPPAKDNTNNGVEMKHKSPFILVKPDGTISVINTATADEVNEKQAKVKKPPKYGHERKTIRGMHSSTLSNRYDADTTDSTWICVFCKRGPHRKGLGDLFGPYLVTIDCEEYQMAIDAYGSQDFDTLFTNKRKRADMVKARERNLPVVPATLAKQQLQLQQQQISPKQKRKKKTTDEQTPPQPEHKESAPDPLDCTAESTLIENFRGMLKTSENSYEVWVHEDCTVWAPNVLLVGGRIVGLDAAVWDSTRYFCSICSQAGGIVCCFQRDCKAVAHIPCARESQWSLIEIGFKAHCQKHLQR